MKRGGSSAALLAGTVVLSCNSPRLTASRATPPDGPTTPIVDAAVPARCSWAATEPAPAALSETLEVGEAISIGPDVAVGAVVAADASRAGSVVRFGKADPVTVHVGDACHDVEPPQPFTRRGELFAATCVHRKTPSEANRGTESLALFAIRGASAEHLVDLPGAPQVFDVAASADTDPVAGALLVWGEDGGPAASIKTVAPGGLKVVSLASDLRSVLAVRAVPGTAGAMDPRLASRGAGFWLAWIASRAERPPAASSAELEAPSEERMFSWVELAALDETGQVVGSVRRLTSATGHVGGYSLWAHGDAIDLVANDGGALVRAVARVDGAVESSVIVRAIDRASPPSIVPAAPTLAWLTFEDLQGETELLPLDDRGAAGSRPGPEPSLAMGRLLATVGTDDAKPGRYRLAVATTSPVEPHWSLRWATCGQ